MKAAVIAAGLGERLQAAGITAPKPLLPVNGEPLIDHTLRAVVAAGLADVACIVNEVHHGIEEHCRARWPELRFEFVRRTTPSSMESLFALAPLLGSDPFLLLTVDAIFAPTVLADFVAAASRRDDVDGVLALTSFVDDEKPLWAATDRDGRITRLGPEAGDSGWITAGFYLFRPTIFREIGASRRGGFTALRQFLGRLVERDYRLFGESVGMSVDVDRPQDVGMAEAFIRRGYVGAHG